MQYNTIIKIHSAALNCNKWIPGKRREASMTIPVRWVAKRLRKEAGREGQPEQLKLRPLGENCQFSWQWGISWCELDGKQLICQGWDLAWAIHNLLKEGFTTQKEKSFTMISRTEQIRACVKKKKAIFRKDQKGWHLDDFLCPYFKKQIKLFLLTVSSRPLFIFPSHDGQWWSEMEGKDLISTFLSRNQEAGAEGIQHHQRITFRLLLPACSIIVSLKNSSSLLKGLPLGFLSENYSSVLHFLSSNWRDIV